MPGHNMRSGSASKPKNIGKTTKRMIKDFKKEMPLIIIIILLSIASATLIVYAPILLKDILSQDNIKTMFVVGADMNLSIDWAIFGQKFGVLILVYVISALLQWLSQFVSVSIGAKYAYNMRDKVQNKLDRLPLSYFDRVAYGDTLSIGTNDVDNISRNIQTIITQTFLGVTLFLGSFIAMLATKWELALIALCALPITLMIVFLVTKFSGKQFTKYRHELGILNGKVEEDYAGYMIIKLFNKEDDVEKEFSECNERMAKADNSSQFLSGLIFPLTIFINNLGYVAIAVLAGMISDAATMIVFFLFFRAFTSPFQQLGQIANVMQSVVASGERIYELLDQDEEDRDKKGSISTEDNIKGNFKFNDVFDLDKLVSLCFGFELACNFLQFAMQFEAFILP